MRCRPPSSPPGVRSYRCCGPRGRAPPPPRYSRWQASTSRGEPRCSAVLIRRRGSSPRARGAEGDPLVPVRGDGVIPACAGSSVWRSGPCRGPGWSRGHPRVRGEQFTLNGAGADNQGSCPRARGAGFAARPAPAPGGVIPACAGSRARFSGSWAAPRGHPRVRGEQLSPSPSGVTGRGSSPRARGADHGGALQPVVLGVIPGCAGSRATCTSPAASTRGHPRVRGEQCYLGVYDSGGTGSSPRARGAGDRHRPDRSPDGVIPACAGSRARALGQAGADGVIPACAGSRLAEQLV